MNNNNPTYQLPLAIENIDFTDHHDTSALFLQLTNLRVRIREQVHNIAHPCTECLTLHTYDIPHRNCTVCKNTEYQRDLAYLIIGWMRDNQFSFTT